MSPDRSNDDAGGYVHRPSGADERAGAASDGVATGREASDRGAPDRETDGSSAADRETDDRGTEAGDPDGFGRAGWLLVAAVVGCFLVIPGIIYLNPTVPARAGLPFFATFLVLPLIPALGLGLLAVWSMQAAS